MCTQRSTLACFTCKWRIADQYPLQVRAYLTNLGVQILERVVIKDQLGECSAAGPKAFNRRNAPSSGQDLAPDPFL
jgi:hypothetical protein